LDGVVDVRKGAKIRANSLQLRGSFASVANDGADAAAEADEGDMFSAAGVAAE
jgi:hypothetical protein